MTVLPKSLVKDLEEWIARSRKIFEEDRAAHLPGVWIPGALGRKLSRAGETWDWFWLFPAKTTSIDPQTGIKRRHLAAVALDHGHSSRNHDGRKLPRRIRFQELGFALGVVELDGPDERRGAAVRRSVVLDIVLQEGRDLLVAGLGKLVDIGVGIGDGHLDAVVPGTTQVMNLNHITRDLEITDNGFQVGSAKAIRVSGVKNLTVRGNRLLQDDTPVENPSAFTTIHDCSGAVVEE